MLLAAPLPAFAKPGARRLSKTSFILKRVSRTRLNVLGSYAADDHR
jgi:hypothetical protein